LIFLVFSKAAPNQNRVSVSSLSKEHLCHDCVRHNFHIGSGAHPSSYPPCALGSFPRS
jgi:hypothetical protein